MAMPGQETGEQHSLAPIAQRGAPSNSKELMEKVWRKAMPCSEFDKIRCHAGRKPWSILLLIRTVGPGQPDFHNRRNQDIPMLAGDT